MKPLITVPIQSSTPARIEKELQSARDRVEAYEVWLDCLEKKDLFPGRVEKLVRHWKKMTKKKLIVVCKDLSEQGKFRGTSKEKADLLLAAADGGADYLDLGTRSGKKWIEAVVLKKKKAKVTVSFHDFKRTPSAARLKSIAKRMVDLKADIIKIATFVNTLEDTQKLIDLALELKKKRQPHIVVGMGEKGISTRILGQKLGNELQFVTLEERTAPGQLSLQEMLAFQKVL